MIERVLGTAFATAVSAMVFAAFLWPLAIGTDGASTALRIVCLTSFALYLLAMLGKLRLRLRQGRQP